MSSQNKEMQSDDSKKRFDDEQMKRDEALDEQFLQAGFACLEEKVPEACVDYAQHLLYRKNFDTAIGVLKDQCDTYRHSITCFKLAEIYGRDKYKEYEGKDQKQAGHYFQKSCDYGHGLGCLVNGIRLSNPKDESADFTEALKSFERGCDNFEKRSCLFASEFYRQGKVVSKDPVKALKLASAGCELGNLNCCANAYLMTKNGDGVPQSEEMAKIFRDKARKSIRSQDRLMKGLNAE